MARGHAELAVAGHDGRPGRARRLDRSGRDGCVHPAASRRRDRLALDRCVCLCIRRARVPNACGCRRSRCRGLVRVCLFRAAHAGRTAGDRGHPARGAAAHPGFSVTAGAAGRRRVAGAGRAVSFPIRAGRRNARDRRLLAAPQPDIAGHGRRYRRHGRERGRRCGARRGSLQLACREHRAKPAARSRRRIRGDACHRLYRLLLVDVVDRPCAAVVRGLQGLAACAAAAVGRARQHRVSQPDRSQGISLHLSVGRAAGHRRSPRLGRLDAGASEQAFGPPVCGTADRRRLDRRFRRARRNRLNAGILEPGNRRGQARLGAQGRSADVRSGALRHAVLFAAGKGSPRR